MRVDVDVFLDSDNPAQKTAGAIVGGEIKDALLLKELRELDRLLVSSYETVKCLKTRGNNYNDVLGKAIGLLQKIVNREEFGTPDHNALLTIKSEYVERIKKLIGSLSEITDQIDEMTEFEDENLLVPAKIYDFLEDAHSRGWGVDNKALSIAMLKQIQDDKVRCICDSNGIPYSSTHRIMELCKKISDLRKTIELSNQWIHDANHYMCKLMNRIERFSRNQTQIKNIHSIDAMLHALRTLRSDYEEEIGWKKSEDNQSQSARLYYPYKLFHKFRYCYDNEGVQWVPQGENFTSPVLYARGMESVALNIYGNAIKYLSKYYGRKEVYTSFLMYDGYVEIKISSMGPVVKEEERGRLCEDGFRAASVKEKYRGRGRGLALISRICKEAGYEFFVDPDIPISEAQSYLKFNVIIRIPRSCIVGGE